MSNACVLSLWLIVSTVQATEPASDLSAALKKYQNVEQLHVSFEQTKKLKDMDFELRSQGDLSWAEDRMLWRIRSPAPARVEWLNGEIQIGERRESIPEKYRRELEQLVNWVKLDARELQKNYEVSRASEKSFVFTPRDRDGVFQAMRLTLNKQGFAESVELSEISGDRMLLKFGRPRIQYKK